MVSWFSLLFSFVVAQRLIELGIAKRNARFILSQGGFEIGAEHYKYLVLIHVAFFLFWLVEVRLRGLWSSPPEPVPLIVFLAAQALRIWCILSLGKFWNTRIFLLPGSDPIVHGPYRYMRHPNYAVVTIEIFVLPLVFQAVVTSVLFSILNAIVLRVRIQTEERALAEYTNYTQPMESKGRFWPVRKR